MDLLKTKYIGNDQVDGTKILIAKNATVRSKKGDNSVVNLIYLNGADLPTFDIQPICNEVPAANDDLVNKLYVDTLVNNLTDSWNHTVTAGEVAAAKIALPAIPNNLDRTQILILGGIPPKYTTDFTIDVQDGVAYIIGDLCDTVLEAGDKIIVLTY